MTAAFAFEADVRTQSYHRPFIRAARVRLAQTEQVVEFKVGEHGWVIKGVKVAGWITATFRDYTAPVGAQYIAPCLRPIVPLQILRPIYDKLSLLLNFCWRVLCQGVKHILLKLPD